MDKFVIIGGAALRGEIPTNGSKNSALPALAAGLLTDEAVTLHRVPRVRDIRTMERLLVDIGTTVDVEGETVRMRTERILSPEAPYELVKTMRASSLVLGPLVARSGRARVSLPGGCAIGARPINLHIFGLEQLGATINQAHGYIEAVAPDGLRGATVNFDRITVTGTEDLMMAAVLAKGETVLRNAAREPEVVDLADLLVKMGASIEGAGTSTIRIQGVERLGGAEHTIIADRIEAGTFLVAGAITGGDLTVTRCNPEHLGALVSKLQQCGLEVTQPDDTSLRVRGNRTAAQCRYDHGRVSRLRHRSAGAVHGVDDAGGGDRDRRRDDLREPLHARAGTGAHGRQYPARRQTGDHRRTARVDRRRRDRERSARQRVAGAGRPGGERRDRDRSRVPHRPGL